MYIRILNSLSANKFSVFVNLFLAFLFSFRFSSKKWFQNNIKNITRRILKYKRQIKKFSKKTTKVNLWLVPIKNQFIVIPSFSSWEMQILHCRLLAHQELSALFLGFVSAYFPSIFLYQLCYLQKTNIILKKKIKNRRI